MSTVPMQVFVRRVALHTRKGGLNGLLSVLSPAARDLHVPTGRFQGGQTEHSISQGQVLCFRKMYNQFAENSRKMSDFAGKGHDIIFRQLLEYKSFTYTYLLADPDSKEAILIDPVIETAERDAKLVKDMGLKLVYGVNTHVHADHITGTGALKRLVPECKSVIAEVSGAVADVKIKHGDKIKFGKYEIEARSTPGHTSGCMSYVWHEKGMVFTGDAVLIRGCGRTDFQQGNAEELYDSVHTQIFSLPPDFMIFPAHDYTGQTMSTVAEEKTLNPRLIKGKTEFATIMKNLNLPYPKQIGGGHGGDYNVVWTSLYQMKVMLGFC